MMNFEDSGELDLRRATQVESKIASANRSKVGLGSVDQLLIN